MDEDDSCGEDEEDEYDNENDEDVEEESEGEASDGSIESDDEGDTFFSENTSKTVNK